MIIIPVSERRRVVIDKGIKMEDDNWVVNPDKTRVGFQKLKKGEWVNAKGVQFDKALIAKIGQAMIDYAGQEG